MYLLCDLAAMQRARSRGRDFYDISFLWARVDPDYNYLEQVLDLPKQQFIEFFLSKLPDLDFQALAEDVRPFLHNPQDLERILTFEAYARQKLG